jgi:hypothetical protein
LGVERIAFALAGAVVVAGALAWAAGVLPHSIQDRVLRLFRVNGVSLSGPVNDVTYSSVDRLAHWIAGIRMFLAHPVLGVGAGNYGAAYARYAVPEWHASLSQAHNYYINAAAETGAIGLAAFLALVAAMLYAAWRAAHAHALTQPIDSPGNSASTERPLSSSRLPFRSIRGASGREPAASQRAQRAAPPDSIPRAANHSTRATSGTLAADRPARIRKLLLVGQPLSAILAGSWTRALALGLLGVFVAVAVHSFVDDVFVHAIELQIALCMALAVAVHRSPLSAGRGVGGEVSSPGAQEQE